MKRPFKLLGNLSLVVFFALCLAGVWTYTFEATDGTLVSYRKGENIVGSSNKFTYNDWDAYPTFVGYTYSIGGVAYKGNSIGMGLRPWTLSPLSEMQWEKDMVNGNKITVYYFERDPTIALLHRGPDILMCVVSLFIGLSFRWFSNWMFQFENRPI